MTKHKNHKNPKKNIKILTKPPKTPYRRKTPIWVPTCEFYGGTQDCLLVGFDTEFEREGKHNNLLSYQFHVKHPNGSEWKGIGYLRSREDRITLNEFFEWVFSEGFKQHKITKYPQRIYLIGHFTIADLPGFSNFNDMKHQVNAVRKCLVTTSKGYKVELMDSADQSFEIKAIFRDSMLLAPTGKQRLADIGTLVGVDKLSMSEDEISNMSSVLENDPEKFERYAMRDAEICVKYSETILKVMEEISGERLLPSTVGSIGVSHLQRVWVKNNRDRLAILGKEIVKDGQWQKHKQQYWMSNKEVNVPMRHLKELFATECYHGGRNEQYFFGIGEDCVWTDYDLCGAYTTAMSLIKLPLWDELYSTVDLKKLTNLKSMGFAYVDFEFPDETRFPCLPIRSNGGLIFPLKGSSNCSTPELFLAQQMGAKLKVRDGFILPTDSSVRPFAEFIKECTHNRKSHPKGSIFELFWKEIGNSTYGKTAQGLREKRCFDTRTADVRLLPESEISNPFFSAYVTSFVRAALGEILHLLPKETLVSNATTDGFLSTAGDDQLEHITSGELCQMFGNTRKSITGDFEVLEVKHKIRQPLGWRTRGQATLLPLKGEKMILAKAGMKPKTQHKLKQNTWIEDRFFQRTPEETYEFDVFTSLRDIWLKEYELTSFKIEKRLSMEYDWKRMSCNPTMRSYNEHSHLYFDTKPWADMIEYSKCRESWAEYNSERHVCLKTVEDYDSFNAYQTLDIKGTGLKKSRKDPVIKTAWKMFVRSYARSEWGLDKTQYSYPEMSEWLSKAGYPTKRTDFENGSRKTMKLIENIVPRSDETLKFLKIIKERFPQFYEEKFFVVD